MQIRWWNSFNVLAVILFAIGIIGAFSGGRMVFDPGRAQSGKEWIIYLVAGGLMLINGLLPTGSPQHVHDHPQNTPGKNVTPAGETPAAAE
jgi:hypothetical protein